MSRSWAATDPRSRFNLVALGLFGLVLLFFGGASRGDELGQPLVRVGAILLIVSSGLQIDWHAWDKIRAPVFFLLAAAIVIAVQLVPVPEAIWRGLPGREVFATALEEGQIGSSARPLSLTPDLTLNSLLALLPPAAAALCLGLIARNDHGRLLAFLLLAIAAGAFLGVTQVSTGGPYLYRTTNLGSAVGIFANRNHQALALAMAFPLLAAWATLPWLERRPSGIRGWIAICFALLLVPILLVTGSRSGILLALLGMIAAAVIVYRQVKSARGEAGITWLPRLALAVTVAIAALVAISVYFSRAEAIQRLAGVEDFEPREQILPILVRMAADFFPMGAGFGSFDPVYRSYEPAELLAPTYLNHAHNDLVQVLIEGGAPAAALVLAFLFWFVVRAARLWLRPPDSQARLIGVASSAAMSLILISSLFDYPLRTPSIAVLAVILCCWMLPSARQVSGAR